MDRNAGDGADSAEDSGSSQPYPSTLPGIPKACYGAFFLFPFFSYLLKKLVYLHSLKDNTWCLNLALLLMLAFYFRAVPDSCFSVCKDQWKRILWRLILRKSSILAGICIPVGARFVPCLSLNSLCGTYIHLPLYVGGHVFIFSESCIVDSLSSLHTSGIGYICKSWPFVSWAPLYALGER